MSEVPVRTLGDPEPERQPEWTKTWASLRLPEEGLTKLFAAIEKERDILAKMKAFHRAAQELTATESAPSVAYAAEEWGDKADLDDNDYPIPDPAFTYVDVEWGETNFWFRPDSLAMHAFEVEGSKAVFGALDSNTDTYGALIADLSAEVQEVETYLVATGAHDYQVFHRAIDELSAKLRKPKPEQPAE